MKKTRVFAAICIVCVLVAVALLAVACLPMSDIPLSDPERGVDPERGFDPERGVDATRRGGISFTVASYNVWSGGNTLENEYAIAPNSTTAASTSPDSRKWTPTTSTAEAEASRPR